MPECFRIVWQASTMRWWSASSLSTGAAYTRVLCVPTGKIQRIPFWRVWRPFSWSPSTYPSVTIGVTENISHSTTKMCRNTITRVSRSCSDCQWYTSSSSFGWSCKRKSREWLPVSRCGKTCGSTKQSPTIPAHTLMLNRCWCLLSILSAIGMSQIKCFRTHVNMDMCVCVLGYVTRAQSLSATFRYIHTYMLICIHAI
jgi:hypothetical protein